MVVKNNIYEKLSINTITKWRPSYVKIQVDSDL